MMLHTDQPEILKIPISGENGGKLEYLGLR